jgi:hypothetical protein
MSIHRVSKGLAFQNRLRVLLGQLECTCDTGVDVVTLLKVDVLKEIAASPTGPAGMELPYISMPASRGMAPSTGISLLRRYSSMVSSTSGVAITTIL